MTIGMDYAIPLLPRRPSARQAGKAMLCLLALLVVSIVLLPAVPLAQEPSNPAPPRLADGEWLGSAVITGPIEAQAEGRTLVWNGQIDGSFYLEVEDGRATGAVTLEGPSTMQVRGMPMALVFENSGTGMAAGQADAFMFEGLWTERMLEPMLNSHTHPLRVEIRITEATCTSVRGEWIQDWNTLVQQAG